jgi:addiction module HigA family antidote
LRATLGCITLGILSGILNGNKGISPEMSLRMARALGTHDSFWHDMQSNYDLWQAKRKKLPAIQPFFQAA